MSSKSDKAVWAPDLSHRFGRASGGLKARVLVNEGELPTLNILALCNPTSNHQYQLLFLGLAWVEENDRNTCR